MTPSVAGPPPGASGSFSSYGFVEKIGLDPGDKDWELIGRDWVKPDDSAAYHCLAWKLSVLHGRQ